MATKKIALFIDADNVSAKFGKQIIDELSHRGEIFIRRIYGNWEKNILHGWNECILNFSLRAVQQTDFVAGKNATDMSLTIDAMDVLYGGRADVFALVSNDSDFTPLAIRLREGGMTVLGLGNGKAANSFRMACSEFIDLDAPPVQEKFPIEQISKPVRKKPASKENSPVQLNLFDDETKVVELKPQTSAPEKISPPKVVTPAPKVAAQVQSVVKISPVTNPKVVSLSERHRQDERDKKIQLVHELLSEVAQIHGDEQGFTPLCWAGQTLRKKNLGFGIKDVGYSSFRMFVAAFPKIYELIRRTNGENFCFRCLDSAQISDDEKIRQIHDVLRDAAEIYADAEGFADLCRAGDTLRKKNLDVKVFGYGTLSSFVCAFPKLYEIRKVGKKFYYRCQTDAPKNSADDSKTHQLHDVLREAWTLHAAADGFVDFWWTCDFLVKKNFPREIKSLSYKALVEFVSAYPARYELRTDGGNNFSYRYRTDAQKNSADDSRLNQLHEILREAAETHADAKGFSLLNHAGTAIKNQNLGFGIKDFGYRQLREFVAAFPELYEIDLDDTRKHFRYRPRQKFLPE